MKEKERNMYSLLKMKREMTRALFVVSTCLFLSLALSTSALAKTGNTSRTSLYVVNADGKGKKRVTKPDSYNGAWSPDGSMIAYSYSKKNSVKDSIYTANADGSNRKKITKGKRTPIYEVSWVSEDKISYTRLKTKKPKPRNSTDLFVVNIDGTGLKRIIKARSAVIGNINWSPDGNEVAYTLCGEGAICDVYTANSDGTGGKRIVRNVEPLSQSVVWSTDGKQIAFVDAINDVNAKFTVYVVNKDGSGKSLLTKLTKRAKPTTLTAIDITSDFKKIAYNRIVGRGYDIYTVNSDGSGFKRVAKNRRRGANVFMVYLWWSPDGSKIMFDSGIFFPRS